jgi:hypothetical protein
MTRKPLMDPLTMEDAVRDAEDRVSARSARDAAWEAARFAKSANWIATLALVMAVIAVAVSIFALVHGSPPAK